MLEAFFPHMCRLELVGRVFSDEFRTTSVDLEEVVEQPSPIGQVRTPPMPSPSLLGLEAGRESCTTHHPLPQPEES